MAEKAYGFGQQEAARIAAAVRRVEGLPRNAGRGIESGVAGGAPRAVWLARADVRVEAGEVGDFTLLAPGGNKGAEIESPLGTVAAYVRRGVCVPDRHYILIEVCAGADAAFEVVNADPANDEPADATTCDPTNCVYPGGEITEENAFCEDAALQWYFYLPDLLCNGDTTAGGAHYLTWVENHGNIPAGYMTFESATFESAGETLLWTLLVDSPGGGVLRLIRDSDWPDGLIDGVGAFDESVTLLRFSGAFCCWCDWRATADCASYLPSYCTDAPYELCIHPVDGGMIAGTCGNCEEYPLVWELEVAGLTSAGDCGDDCLDLNGTWALYSIQQLCAGGSFSDGTMTWRSASSEGAGVCEPTSSGVRWYLSCGWNSYGTDGAYWWLAGTLPGLWGSGACLLYRGPLNGSVVCGDPMDFDLEFASCGDAPLTLTLTPQV